MFVAILMLLGMGIGGTGLLALLSHATGWTIRTRPYGDATGIEVPTDLDFALIATGLGTFFLLAAWLLVRRREARLNGPARSPAIPPDSPGSAPPS